MFNYIQIINIFEGRAVYLQVLRCLAIVFHEFIICHNSRVSLRVVEEVFGDVRKFPLSPRKKLRLFGRELSPISQRISSYMYYPRSICSNFSFHDSSFFVLFSTSDYFSFLFLSHEQFTIRFIEIEERKKIMKRTFEECFHVLYCYSFAIHITHDFLINFSSSVLVV